MDNLQGRSILITGGTGSLGRQLVRSILAHGAPRRLVVFSRDELKQYEMAQEFSPRDHACLRYFLGDIRDRDRLQHALRKIDVVIHTAALKQVPAAEYNPFEFVKTNILGAQNLVDAAVQAGVQQVLALSTDKAANPINLYGATKLCADKLFLAANTYVGAQCRFSVVRYGNVFGSRGSAVPLFLRQRETGTVTLTDERMTRFSLTLAEAAEFVLAALARMQGNEVFVPKIPSYRLTDLVAAVAPGCRVETVGIRPGEKLHEMLISRDEARYTYDMGDYYLVQPPTQYQQFPAAPAVPPMPPEFEYVSNVNDRWLSVERLRAMLEAV